MNTPENLADFVGRLLMSVIFVVAGIQKAVDYQGAQAYMELHGVLSAFLPVAIILEIVGACAIVVGYWTRLFAFLLAIFVVTTAMLFHASFGDPNQLNLFMRDVAMGGGLLVLFARGAGDWSLDARRLGTLD